MLLIRRWILSDLVGCQNWILGFVIGTFALGGFLVAEFGKPLTSRFIYVYYLIIVSSIGLIGGRLSARETRL